jgi:hypothetical protein
MRPADHMPSCRPRRRLPPHVAVGALIAVGTLVAGCGGGGSNAGVANVGASRAPSSRSSASSTYDQALAFANCVRTHGVPLWPNPDSSGQFDKSKLTPRQLGVGSSKAGAAAHACRTLLPTYAAGTQPAQVLAQALTFSRCMRAHGSTNFPDPESNGAIVIPHAMENSPVYLAALRFCIRKYGVPPPPAAEGRGRS